MENGKVLKICQALKDDQSASVNPSCMVQGSPEAKQVVQRLIPLQNDTLEEQQEQLPVLAFLTEDQLNSTLARQEHTEELSLVQWTRSVGVQPPPPPDNHAEIVQGWNSFPKYSL